MDIGDGFVFFDAIGESDAGDEGSAAPDVELHAGGELFAGAGVDEDEAVVGEGFFNFGDGWEREQLALLGGEGNRGGGRLGRRKGGRGGFGGRGYGDGGAFGGWGWRGGKGGGWFWSRRWGGDAVEKGGCGAGTGSELFVLFLAKHEDFFAGDAGFDVGFPGDVSGEADEGEAEEDGEPDDLHGK